MSFGLPSQYTTEPDHAAGKIMIRETSPAEPERKIIFSPRERGGFLKREEVWQPVAGKWDVDTRDVIKHLAVQDAGIEGRVIIEEMQRFGADRRTIYNPTEDGFMKHETAYRDSMGRFWERDKKQISHLSIDRPDE
jgi:hypothetical protein